MDSISLFSYHLFSPQMPKGEFSREPFSFAPHDFYLSRNLDVLICSAKQKFSLEGNTSQVIIETWSLAIAHVRQACKGKDCHEDKVDCFVFSVA